MIVVTTGSKGRVAPLFVALAVLLSFIAPQTYAEPRFGGMTAREAFSDPQVANLVEAAQQGDVREVDALVRADANVNAVGAQGVTPLIWVIGARNRRGVELLLEAGADPNYKGLAGANESAMSLAAVKYGADVNIHGRDERTAGDVAAAMGKFDQVAYLLGQGLNYNLAGLAASVEGRQVPRKSEQYQWKTKVIELLKAQGVKFPAFVPGAAHPPPPPK